MRNLLVYFAVLACFSVLVGLPAGSEPNEPRASWSPIESAEPIGIDDWVPPRPECESGSSWTSRHQARTPLSQQDCTHALASVNHKIGRAHV